MKDAELLEAYRSGNCQNSFSELVHRYVGLVYGTARRQVNNPHVAEEISQKVFCTLAQNAGSIRNPEQLPSWLYRTTRQLAAMHFRSEARRARRERMAVMDPNTTDQAGAWNEIEPLLNEAMDNLNEMDRLAILLRFFRENSMAEVAAGLDVSEGAAKMRVSRALEKLRNYFSSLGIACSVAGLLKLLEQNAAASAPSSVTASILKETEKLTPPSNISVGRARVSGIRFQKAAVILTASITVMFLGVKTMRSDRTSTQRAGGEAKLAATERPAATLSPTPETGVSASSTLTSLHLTVLDGETSQPLSGVRVKAGEVGEEFREGITDKNGRCDVTRPSPDHKNFYFRVCAQHDGFATMEVSWSLYQRDDPSDIPTDYVLRMQHGVRVGGSVVNDQGIPIAQAQIRLGEISVAAVPPREREMVGTSTDDSIITDAGGFWTFDRLPTDWKNVHFMVDARGYLPADFVTDANDRDQNGRTKIQTEQLLQSQAVLRLRSGIYLLGHVLDQHNEPIAEARVVQNYNWHDYPRVTTGKDGAYEIFNAATGSVTLSIQANHYAPQSMTLTVAEPGTNKPIILQQGHVLRGRVIDTEGKGVANAEVGVEQSRDFQWSTKTDAEGRFFWDGAPINPASYVVVSSGFDVKQTTLAADGSEHTLQIARNDIPTTLITRVQGSVWDESTGQPIENFQILIGDGGPAAEGTNGSFSVRLRSDSKTEAIEIQAKGYLPARIENIATSGGDKTLEFKLKAATGWNGQVLLPNGEPAAGAELAFSGTERSPILGKRRLLFKQNSINGVTDSLGKFHFEPVLDAKLIVAVHEQGYAECNLDQLAHSPIIWLQPWGRIEGEIRSGGHTAANKRVSLLKRFWNPWTLGIGLNFETFSAATDANGRFVFESVPPGEFSLGYRANDKRTTIQVKPGVTTTVQLGGNGRDLVGRVSIPDAPNTLDFSKIRGLLERRQSRRIELPRRTFLRSDYSSDEEYQKAQQEEAVKLTDYWQSTEGLEAWREHRTYAIWFDAEGSLHGEDIPADNYNLKVFVPAKPFGFYAGSIRVPEKNVEGEDTTLDLGMMTLEYRSLESLSK